MEYNLIVDLHAGVKQICFIQKFILEIYIIITYDINMTYFILQTSRSLHNFDVTWAKASFRVFNGRTL